MSKDMFVRSILPIGVLFSGSLILSNTAYLYLSVSYIQMLKVRGFLLEVERGDADEMNAGVHTRRYPPDLVDVPHRRAE